MTCQLLPTHMGNRIIDQMVTDLVAAFSPLEVILFGSMARGTADAESDADLLVVMPEGTPLRKTAVAMRKLLARADLAKDIVVTTPSQIREFGNLHGSIIGSAVQEGFTLYAV